jgi:hypothetical protein
MKRQKKPQSMKDRIIQFLGDERFAKLVAHSVIYGFTEETLIDAAIDRARSEEITIIARQFIALAGSAPTRKERELFSPRSLEGEASVEPPPAIPASAPESINSQP